jgi:hypothetical protein
MPDRADASSDDFVCVATRDSPIEAHLLMGVLTPHLADEHMVQNYSLLSPAVGGVRVLVPASQLAAARATIADFEAGAFRLEE